MLALSPSVPGVLSDEVLCMGGAAIVCVATQGGIVALTIGGENKVLTLELTSDQAETLAGMLTSAARIKPK